MKIYLLIILLLVCPVFGFGQRTGTSPPQTVTVYEDNLTLSKYPDKALVYIYSYKTTKTLGTVKKAIFMDGKELGNVRPTRFFGVLAAPGKHAFHFKNKKKNGVEMNFEAGKIYFLRGVWDAGVTVTISGLIKMEQENGIFDIKQMKSVDSDDIKDKSIVHIDLP